MELTGTIRLTKQRCVVLDLLAVSLLAGAVWALLATVAGAWSPLSSVDPQEAWWCALPLFAGCLLGAVAVGVAIALHVQLIIAGQVAHSAERTVDPLQKSLVTGDRVGDSGAAVRVSRELRGPVEERVVQAAEDEEPELVGAATGS